jgi:hypothetical protein
LKPVLLSLDFQRLCLRRYVPLQHSRGFISVEEWTVKDRDAFFGSITPVTCEQLRKDG